MQRIQLHLIYILHDRSSFIGKLSNNIQNTLYLLKRNEAVYQFLLELSSSSHGHALQHTLWVFGLPQVTITPSCVWSLWFTLAASHLFQFNIMHARVNTTSLRDGRKLRTKLRSWQEWWGKGLAYILNTTYLTNGYLYVSSIFVSIVYEAF